MTTYGQEFPSWLSRLKTQHSICEDTSLIPGLAQWVKDAVLPQAIKEVEDAAQIWHCRGCGASQQLAQELPYYEGVAEKRKKHTYRQKHTSIFMITNRKTAT